jgi:hypothetical protein
MEELPYLHSQDTFLNYAFDVLQKYFSDRQRFDDFFESIVGEEAKNRFLKITSFYKFLVKDGKFGYSDRPYVDYIDETYKYVGLVSLIEALYGQGKYLDFYEWIRKQPDSTVFPIGHAAQLEKLYAKYKQDYGVTHKIVLFFKSLDADSQEVLRKKLKLKRNEEPVEALAKLLYQIRSEFLHKAKLILEFGQTTTISTRKGKIVQSDLTLNNLQSLFERGLLLHFGYSGKFI